VKIGVHFVYENIRFGLLEPKHDGTADFATPGNTRATKQAQILKQNLNIGFKKYKLAATNFTEGVLRAG
jgi:hypothetical protein